MNYLKICAFCIVTSAILAGCYGPGNCYSSSCYYPGYDAKTNYPFGLYSTSNYSRPSYHPPTDLYYYDPYAESTHYYYYNMNHY